MILLFSKEILKNKQWRHNYFIYYTTKSHFFNFIIEVQWRSVNSDLGWRWCDGDGLGGVRKRVGALGAKKGKVKEKKEGGITKRDKRIFS